MQHVDGTYLLGTYTKKKKNRQEQSRVTVVYIQNSLTLEYTAQVLNLFNSLIFQYGINPLFFLLRILSILKHTQHIKNIY